MAADKPHVSLVVVGHVDSGKSTTAGRLLFELGSMSPDELAKLKGDAAALGKPESSAYAFHMDRLKEERQRGVTITCTTKECFTDKWHYSIIDAPGATLYWTCMSVQLPFCWPPLPLRCCPPPLASSCNACHLAPLTGARLPLGS
jgi:translation elongation factor EF-1alpha